MYNPIPPSKAIRVPEWVYKVLDKLSKAPEFYIAILQRLPEETRKDVIRSFCPRCADRVFGTHNCQCANDE